MAELRTQVAGVVLDHDSGGMSGLSTHQVAALRAEHGPNALPEPRRSVWRLVGRQFQDVLVWILLGAMVLSAVVPLFEHAPLTAASFLDAYVIGAILVLNAVLGFVQEYRAESAIAALKRMSAHHARVRRDGREQEILAEELVPGDLLLLTAGDRVAADGLLLGQAFLQVDESGLTGESVPVSKGVGPADPAAPLADQLGQVFGGTLVTRGTGTARVTATGPHTETGRIAALVGAAELPATPLQLRLAALGRTLGYAALVVCGVVVAIGVVRGLPPTELLMLGLSLAVSAVPEGLPAVVTVCFALGVRRMAAHDALVRRLDSLETLGCVTVICTDKTGTLTENRMTVVAEWLPEGGDRALLGTALASCNHAVLPELGDPTELAVLRFGERVGGVREPIDQEEVPFTSEVKHMRTRHGGRSFLKGAPERIVPMCADGADTDVLAQVDRLAAQGLRVLAAAVADGDGPVRLLGLVGMADPPREGVADAIAQAEAAGIRTIMITGDNRITAQAIAAQVGLGTVGLVGPDLDALDDAGLAAAVADTDVFARVSPEHKIRITRALQARGEVVAMSGDGVNDAPALKAAHVGIAMGLRGTEVAREAASIVLADDHYATIVRAIGEGRRITDNIRKFVVFLLRANFDELLLLLTTVALGWPLPFLPVHILWINLMTDGLPALALGAEPAEPDVMARPPTPPGQPLLAHEWGGLALASVVAFGMTLGFYAWQLEHAPDLDAARSATLTLAIVFELVLAMSARSRLPLWRIDPFGNRWLLGAIAVVLGLHLVLLYTPLAVAFHLVPLGGGEWLRVLVTAAVCGVAFEALKGLRVVRRR